MFDCVSAAKLPTTIVRSAETQTNGSQRRDGPNAVMKIAQEHGEGGGFGTGGHERGDRGGRALIDVRRPDLERRGRDLERQARRTSARPPGRPSRRRAASGPAARCGSRSDWWFR